MGMSDQVSDKIIDVEVSEEFAGAKLGDARLERRLLEIVHRLSLKPAESFPSVFSQESELEAFYRFIRNPKIFWEKLLEPHFSSTCKRASQSTDVIVVHDSSQLQFSRRQKEQDIGFVSHRSVGLIGHFSLAVSFDGVPKPLGLSHLKTIRRLKKAKGKKDNEYFKWMEGIEESRLRLGCDAALIHVADREADSYCLLADLVKKHERFVLRMAHDRVIQQCQSKSRLSALLPRLPLICEREVFLSPRAPQKEASTRKRFPARRGRKAKLSISATLIEVVRSDKISTKEYPPTVSLNLVHVYELETPSGEPAVDWKLLTTEPIASEEQILKIVDIYRARWLIEEFFKALKTGCSYEDRQLESFKTVTNTLALMVPIAWQMLELRHQSRLQESRCSALSDIQKNILVKLSKGKLNENSSARDFLYAVARLGGHIKNNGAPGWLVLYRGMRELHTLERGVLLNLGPPQHVINH